MSRERAEKSRSISGEKRGTATAGRVSLKNRSDGFSAYGLKCQCRKIRAWLPEGNHRKAYQLDLAQTRKAAENRFLELPHYYLEFKNRKDRFFISNSVPFGRLFPFIRLNFAETAL